MSKNYPDTSEIFLAKEKASRERAALPLAEQHVIMDRLREVALETQRLRDKVVSVRAATQAPDKSGH
jgi:hypothetical protein